MRQSARSTIRILICLGILASSSITFFFLLPEEYTRPGPLYQIVPRAPIVPHEATAKLQELGKGNEVEKPDTIGLQDTDVYHTVFSTGCSTFQNWQSYIFFYHALYSGQEGPVTRIASGCKGEDEKHLLDSFEKKIASMAPGRFHLHRTPDFSGIHYGEKYEYVSP